MPDPSMPEKTDAPFARTTCACRQCVACCKSQPGMLAPGDVERIVAYARLQPEDVPRLFRKSPGALVRETTTKRVAWIGTITPRLDHGRCVFLTEADRCRIHDVAPFGCAYFDMHMDEREGQRRSAWGLREILNSADYAALRENLPPAETWQPRGCSA